VELLNWRASPTAASGARADVAAAPAPAAITDPTTIGVERPPPSKFEHTSAREHSFWCQFHEEASRDAEPEPEPDATPEPELKAHGSLEAVEPEAASDGDGSRDSGDSFVSSTLGLPNRVADLAAVQRHLCISERGGGGGGGGGGGAAAAAAAQVVLAERDERGRVLARGYRRLLLGDHGPYFELGEHQACVEGANLCRWLAGHT
jgi:hypothetical protein